MRLKTLFLECFPFGRRKEVGVKLTEKEDHLVLQKGLNTATGAGRQNSAELNIYGVILALAFRIHLIW